jgi:HNH endonuclease
MTYSAIYSLVGEALAEAALASGGGGVLAEGRRWVRAKELLAQAAQEQHGLPLLLADAAQIRGVEWVGWIRSVEVERRGTRVAFAGLARLARPIRLRRLLKDSDGQPLSDSYIRPYVPCLMTSKVASPVLQALDTNLALETGSNPDREQSMDSALRTAAAESLSTDSSFLEAIRTTREALIDARIGQGRFRTALMRLWGRRCALTGASVPQCLVASHMKPWSKCTNAERLDPHNGLLLCANADRLFDAGLISFSDSGELLLKAAIAPEDLKRLGIAAADRLRSVRTQHLPFLRDHRAFHGFIPNGFSSD